MKTSEVWKITILGQSWKLAVPAALSWSYHSLQRCNYKPLLYDLNRTTVPEFGRIFCFKSPDDITNFVARTHSQNFSPYKFSNFVVFKGTAENPIRQRVMSNYVDSNYLFWKVKQKKRAFKFQKNTPPGTITCTAFTPTKRYTWDEFVNEFSEPSIWN